MVALKVLERCRVAPPPGTVAATDHTTLPLTFWDARWLNFHPCPGILFYKFPCTKTHFIDTVIPKLKQSLSLTLKHYFPLATNLVFNEESGKPLLEFMEGNSVSVLLAESSDDFNYLVGDDHSRNCDRFYSLIPKIPPPFIEFGIEKTPLSALQVTLFPNLGISIAFSLLHNLCDFGPFLNFLKTWSLIYKLNGDNVGFLDKSSLLPFYDRNTIKDPYNLLEKILNDKKKQKNSTTTNDLSENSNKVRATFVMHQTDIKNLKNYIFSKRPNAIHISSWTVTCAYLWICWLKSLEAIGEKVDEKENQYFLCPVNYRARLHPPLPMTYLGNCIGPSVAKLVHDEIVESDGLINAAVSIGEAIHTSINDLENVWNGTVYAKVDEMKQGRVFIVSGSPLLFDTHGVDFGWGKMNTFEPMITDIDGSLFIQGSRKFQGAVEISLSLEKKRMDAFATIFNTHLSYDFGKSNLSFNHA